MADINRMIHELRREREQLTEAIARLEILESGKPRRGRPPAWLAKAKAQKKGAASEGRKRRQKTATA